MFSQNPIVHGYPARSKPKLPYCPALPALPSSLPCRIIISKSSLLRCATPFPLRHASPTPVPSHPDQRSARCLHQSTPSFPTALPPTACDTTHYYHSPTTSPSPRQPPPPTLSLLCTHTHTYTHILPPNSRLPLHTTTPSTPPYSSCSPAPLHASNRCVRTYRAFVHRIASHPHHHRQRAPSPHAYSRPAFTIRRPQRSFLDSLGLASCGSDTFTASPSLHTGLAYSLAHLPQETTNHPL